MDKDKDETNTPETQTPGKPPLCSCVQDPFKDLPPGLRPRPRNIMGPVHKVTCPSCGLVYWTNRKTDLCIDCEKKGVGLSKVNINPDNTVER